MKEYYLKRKLSRNVGADIVNKTKNLQFDRTVFDHAFSTTGHLSLPKIQLTSHNSREANPGSVT